MSAPFPRLHRWLLGCLVLALWVSAPGIAHAEDASTDRIKVRMRMTQPEDVRGRMCIAIAPDGKTVVTGTIGIERVVCVWDAATGKELRHMDRGDDDQGADSVAVSPDGKALVEGCHGGRVIFWDLGSGRQTFSIPTKAYLIPSVAQLHEGQMRLWDVARDKEIRVIQVSHSDTDWLRRIAIAPSDKFLVTGSNNLGVWDMATGKAVREIPQKFWSVESVAISPDEKTIAAGTVNSTVDLYETATGKQLAVMKGHASKTPGFVGVMGVAFSPDGRTVASVGEDATVRIWEVLTCKERLCLKGHDKETTAVCFSPDGRTLVSGSMDGSAVLWDVALTGGKATADPKDGKELQSRWDVLAGDDAADAFRAMGELARSPRQTVQLFEERFRVVTSTRVESVGRLIAQLDSDEFDERERASAALEKLGAGACDALRQALANQPSAEVHERADHLLAKLDTAEERGAEIQRLRAVEVLEQLDTPEARTLLKALGMGAGASRLSQQAKAALDRLDKRQQQH